LRALILAALLLGAAGAQTTKPFSHQVHLKLNPDCGVCHPAAAKSAKLEDNNLPDRKLCLGCHKEVSIKAPAGTNLSRFNHAKHVGLDVAAAIAKAIDSKDYLGKPAEKQREQLNTKNVCAACHRGLETSDVVSKANFPQMADCLVCHSTIDVPFSCEHCHAKTAQLKPANHTADFLDTHTTGRLNLDKTTCAVCHGRTFQCQGCH
jgi:predicted CXXCH cytochrome family protein